MGNSEPTIDGVEVADADEIPQSTAYEENNYSQPTTDIDGRDAGVFKAGISSAEDLYEPEKQGNVGESTQEIQPQTESESILGLEAQLVRVREMIEKIESAREIRIDFLGNVAAIDEESIRKFLLSFGLEVPDETAQKQPGLYQSGILAHMFANLKRIEKRIILEKSTFYRGGSSKVSNHLDLLVKLGKSVLQLLKSRDQYRVEYS
jgi:hypothetical protein